MGRATHRTTAKLGARFDGEVDAFLILVLSVYVARSAGAWVLAIGAARYAFLAAGWPLPWMREPLPPRYWRKVVAATQGIVLTVAAADVLPPALTTAALVVALVLLAESFGRDVLWLWRNRVAQRGRGSRPPRIPAPSSPRPGRARTRAGACERCIAAVLTILAALIVWVALVAPDQPQYLTLNGFLQDPARGPRPDRAGRRPARTPRRILAVSRRTGPRAGGRPEGHQLRGLHALRPAVRPAWRHESARERHRDAALAWSVGRRRS